MADLGFQLAAQPDMVLSVEKDMFYTKQIKDQLKEIAERIMGPRTAELLEPEVKLVGDLLYYGLTLWAGSETLGQEYCSIISVEEQPSGAFIPLTPSRRAATVILTVLLLYTSKRIVKRGGWRTDFQQLGRRVRPRPAQLAGATGPAQPSPSDPPPPASPASLARRIQPAVSAALTSSRRSLSSAAAVLNTHWHVDRWTARLRDRVLPALVSACRPLWETAVRPSLPESREAGLRLAKKLHVMLFFLEARYYTLAQRLAGARSMFTHRVDEGRSSYRALGIFIALELMLRAGSSVAATARRLAQEQPGRAPLREGRVPSGVSSHHHEEEDTPTNSKTGTGAAAVEEEEGEAVVDDRRKCSLCMGVRKDPAATPCGHVFCWTCILGWCSTQPECPLCRSRAPPQSIIYVVNLGQQLD